MRLQRERYSDSATLSVTGRDVVEAEYALTAVEGILWRLDGDGLASAKENVAERKAVERMGDRIMEVYMFVREGGVEVTAKEISDALPNMNNDDAGKYLRRLVDDGHIIKESEEGIGTGYRCPKCPKWKKVPGQTVIQFRTVPIPDCPNCPKHGKVSIRTLRTFRILQDSSDNSDTDFCSSSGLNPEGGKFLDKTIKSSTNGSSRHSFAETTEFPPPGDIDNGEGHVPDFEGFKAALHD